MSRSTRLTVSDIGYKMFEQTSGKVDWISRISGRRTADKHRKCCQLVIKYDSIAIAKNKGLRYKVPGRQGYEAGTFI